jgi:ParB family chromosome partitioning protein
MTRKALGRGLDALLGEAAETGTGPEPGKEARTDPFPETLADGSLTSLEIERISPNPDQPRVKMDPSALKELSDSIASQGILQPLLVSNGPDGGNYTLIAGERRLQAAKMAGLTHVPAIIKEIAPADRLALALIENIQRQDLNVLEEAQAYHRLSADFGLTQEEIAKAVGRDRATVANLIRLLKLPEQVQGDLLEERFSMGHARALLGLVESTPKLLAARAKILAKRLNVRQAERLVDQLKRSALPKPPRPVEVQLKAEEEALRRSLGTKVKISRKGSKGRIQIEFFSDEELDRLLELLKGFSN